MSEMAGVHMRMTDAQLKYIDKRATKLGINKSEVVRALIDKAIRKDAKS